MLLDEVHKLQAEFPDAVYEPDYDNWDCPSYGYTIGSAGNGVGCIVGQAWQRLGVSIKDIEILEQKLLERPESSTTVSTMLIELGFRDNQNVEKLRKIQMNQDLKRKWGEC